MEEKSTDVYDLVEEYSKRLANGEALTIEEFISLHPENETELRPLLPALAVLADLSQNSCSETREQVPIPGVLGDFRIIHEIGRGGMGVVYEAEQVSLSRRVALKVLPFTALLSDRGLRRFQNEARAAASLKHPHIVSVYHVGCDRSMHYYAMELVDGIDLSSGISHLHQVAAIGSVGKGETRPSSTAAVAQLSTQRSKQSSEFYQSVAKLGIQASSALQFAHEEGVVHRDIKPANLLLDRSGSIHITDFGLARVQSQEDLTLTGDVIGTLRYMSPEQLSGDGVVDHRTDIYSLGLTLYELLAGRPAHQSKNRQQLLSSISDSAPISLRVLDPNVPIDLETVIQKAISKHPDDRYQSCEALCDDLRRFVAFKPVKAQRPSMFDSARKWCLRNTLVAAAAVSTILFLALGLAISTWQWRRAVGAELVAKEQVYSSEMQVAFQAWAQGNTQIANEIVNRYGGQRNDIELQLLLAKLSDRTLRSAIETDTRIYEVGFSPDGRYLVALEADKCTVWKYPSCQLHVELERFGYTTSSMAFLQDWLLYTDLEGSSKSRLAKGLIRVANLSSGKVIATLGAPDAGEMTGIDFDVEGKLYACVDVQGQHGQVLKTEELLDVLRGSKTTSMKPIDVEAGDALLRFDFAANEKSLVSIQLGHEVWLRDAETWQLQHKLGVCRGRNHRILFSADGAFVAATGASNNLGHDTRLRIWDTNTREELRILSERESTGSLISFSPSCHTAIAYGGAQGVVTVVDLLSRVTRRLSVGQVQQAAWTPDGQVVACANQNQIRFLRPPPDLSVDEANTSNLVELCVTDDYALTVCEDYARYPKSI